MIAILLACFLALLTYGFSVQFVRGPREGPFEGLLVTQFAHETHLSVFVMLVLTVLGTRLDNPWLALVTGWIAVNVPLGVWLWAHRWLPDKVDTAVQATSQMVFAVGIAFYDTLARTLVPARDLPWWAVGVLAWGALNAYVFLHQRWCSGTPPRGFNHHKIVPGGTDLGLMENSSEFAWLMGVTVVTLAYLALHWHGLFAFALLALLPLLVWARNQSALGAAAVGLAGFASAFSWPLVAGAAVLAMPLVLVALRVNRGAACWQHRRTEWTRAWALLRDTHFLGFGLGSWKNHRYRDRPEGIRQHEWATLHNDWLQSAVEVGVPPVLLAAGYLAGAWWALPATPEAAYAFGLVLYTAAFGILYYPLRNAGQAFVLLVAMAALDAR